MQPNVQNMQQLSRYMHKLLQRLRAVSNRQMPTSAKDKRIDKVGSRDLKFPILVTIDPKCTFSITGD